MTTILIVDSNPQDCAELSSTLRDLNNEVIMANDKAGAILHLDQKHIDLVILDDSVNGLTPEQLLAEFQERDLDTFVIVVTRQPQLNRGMTWIAAGIFAYLSKPISRDDLENIIDKGLENKESYLQVVEMARDLKAANQALTREKAALKEKTEELHFLYQLGLNLSTTLDGQAVVNTVSEAFTNLTNAALVIFLTTFDHGKVLRLHLNRTLGAELSRNLARDLLPEMGLGPEALNFLEILESKNSQRPISRLWPHRLVLPLMAAGKSIGVLGLFFRRPPVKEADRGLILKSMALQTAQALYNAYQHEAALSMASHDSLTGLFNRRAFDDNLAREFERYVRYGTDLTMLMMDLDHFKSVNDRYGHKSGDDVLKTVADIIRRNVRSTDIPARIGGEEFAIILPATDQNKAYKLAKRIESALRRKIMVLDGVEHRQTISQGLAVAADAQVHSPDDLVRLADQALYVAKANGRNSIQLSADLRFIDSGKESVLAFNA
ncbi:MAG: diguanylate cyclase [Deltaproteobacteria bacterium]|nr:diguanylate cyclase [Deltaproteobacteria bacterium]